MTGRSRNEAIKNVVTLVAGVRRRDVHCELGKGTARGWATVTTPARLPADKCAAIERELVARHLISTRLTDHGVDDYEVPCVMFRVER